jgi:integrase
MSKILQKNEMAKRRFFDYLKLSKGFSKDSIYAFEKAILNWEDFTKNEDFANFTKNKIIGFNEWLKSRKKGKTEEKISLSYCYDVLRRLKTFFEWLSKQAGYKTSINSSFINYLRLSQNETREAVQTRKRDIPSVEEVKKTIENIGDKNDVDKRDRALISLAYLSGIRISALMSLPIKSFDKKNLLIDQDPAFGVQTKFRKRIATALIPLSYKEPLDYFIGWCDYLIKEKGFNPNDPIFPATKKEQGDENVNYYNTGEVEPVFWKSGSTIRKIFEKRFIQAGIPYYHPHTLRHLIVKEFAKAKLTEEEKKAISQNLGHANVGTTFGSYGYGHIEEDRQIEIIKGIKFSSDENKKIAESMFSNLSKKDLKVMAEMFSKLASE